MVHERHAPFYYRFRSSSKSIIWEHLSSSWEARFKDGLPGSDESHLHACPPSSSVALADRDDRWQLLQHIYFIAVISVHISRRAPFYVTHARTYVAHSLFIDICEIEESLGRNKNWRFKQGLYIHIYFQILFTDAAVKKKKKNYEKIAALDVRKNSRSLRYRRICHTIYINSISGTET